MTCPRCGAAVGVQQRSCTHCGTALVEGEGSLFTGAAGLLGRGPLPEPQPAAPNAYSEEQIVARLRRFAETGGAAGPPADQAERLRDLAPVEPAVGSGYWAQSRLAEQPSPRRSRQGAGRAQGGRGNGRPPRWVRGLVITGAVLAGAALVALVLLKLLLPDEIVPPTTQPPDEPTRVGGNPLPPADPQVGRITPTRGVDADNRPQEPVTEFLTSDRTIYVAVQVRHGQGESTLSGSWYLNNEPLGGKSFTLIEAADQYYAFALEAKAGQRLAEGLYRLDLELDGQWAGRAEFVVRAPEPPGLAVGHPAVNRVVLATGLDGQGLPLEETTSFAGSADSFFASVELTSPPEADLRLAWYYQDQLIDATVVPLKAGKSEVRGFKLTRREAAWPAGTYYVEVYVGDTLAQRLPFTVR